MIGATPESSTSAEATNVVDPCGASVGGVTSTIGTTVGLCGSTETSGTIDVCDATTGADGASGVGALRVSGVSVRPTGIADIGRTISGRVGTSVIGAISNRAFSLTNAMDEDDSLTGRGGA